MYTMVNSKWQRSKSVPNSEYVLGNFFFFFGCFKQFCEHPGSKIGDWDFEDW